MDRRRNVYFLSDLHLGARYFRSAHEAEKRAVAFLDRIKDDAAEIYLLGDVLDYWYEYRYVVPKGFVRFFGKLAELADDGVKITWLIGNHDIWIFDYLPSELGIEVADGVLEKDILGKRFFLSHGDGVGRLPASFRFLRATFRNKVCQKLYAAIHPRWTIPFAHRWSNHSRDFENSAPKFEGEENEPLIAFSRDYIDCHPDARIDYFVFGHRHIMLDLPLGTNLSRIVILGDWIHHFSYAVFDGKDFRLERFKG